MVVQNISLIQLIFRTPVLQGRGYATAILRPKTEISWMVGMTPKTSKLPTYSCVPLQPPLPYTSSPKRLVYHFVYQYQHLCAQSGRVMRGNTGIIMEGGGVTARGTCWNAYVQLKVPTRWTWIYMYTLFLYIILLYMFRVIFAPILRITNCRVHPQVCNLGANSTRNM
jgi:hypothetical protein